MDRARTFARAPVAAPRAACARVRSALLGLVLVQIYLGALVAGLDAGLIYNTWPLIDGCLIPPAERLWFAAPAWRNLFENTLTVQFDHRMVAYALWLVGDCARRRRRRARCAAARVLNGALALACAVTIQAGLGIVTLLHQAPLPLALLHQITGIAVLTIAVDACRAAVAASARRGRRGRPPARPCRGATMIELTTARRHRHPAHGARQGQRARHRILRGDRGAVRQSSASAAKAVVLTGQGRMFSAGVDLIRLSEGGAAYVRRFLPALHRLLRRGVLLSQARGRGDQRPRHRRRLRAGMLRRQAHRARGGGRIGVTELLVGVPFPALAFEIMRCATPPRYLADGMYSGATFSRWTWRWPAA